MTKERTLVIIKPDALSKKVAGRIISEFENAGLKMLGARMILLTPDEAERFYAEHRGKPFYEPLIDFMISNPVMVTVWEGDGAVLRVRELMGVTDPARAAEGTIRKRWAQDGRHNAVHGSNSLESARREINFFFPEGKDIFQWDKKEYKI